MGKRQPDARAVELSAVPGFRTASVRCGLKGKPKEHDLALLLAEDGPVPAAAVFTRNRIRAAPVSVSQSHLQAGRARAVVVNAGNANCCTGWQGLQDAQAMCAQVARGLGARTTEVLVASTGVIGRPLPMDKVSAGIESLLGAVRQSRETGDFARAILTTDLAEKRASAVLPQGQIVAGVAKGSGMIHPDLGTMLAFLVTDARVTPEGLRRTLREATERTFNRVTVDGETSTNDSVFLLASGRSGRTMGTGRRGLGSLRAALAEVCGALAYQIAADGEGAAHVIVIEVRGAPTERAAVQLARTLALSPLIKTAIAGHDPNWGRILAAAGRSSLPLSEDALAVTLCGVPVFDGKPLACDVRRLSRLLRDSREVRLVLELRLGQATARYLTCDLTHGYITINAQYHT